VCRKDGEDQVKSCDLDIIEWRLMQGIARYALDWGRQREIKELKIAMKRARRIRKIWRNTKTR
jgi:hypothetical protein